MAVQIRRVQDRNTNRVGIERRSSACESWNGTDESYLTGKF
jgi:hypothetical protein